MNTIYPVIRIHNNYVDTDSVFKNQSNNIYSEAFKVEVAKLKEGITNAALNKTNAALNKINVDLK